MSAVTITGYLDGVSYALHADDTDARRGDPTGIIATANDRVASVLEARTGETVAITPTGPFIVATLDSIEGVLAAAYAATEVTTVSGDTPEWYGEVTAGVPGEPVDH